MNKLNGLQVEKLIEKIRENPAIYNRADKYYKHFSVKEKIWKDISGFVGANVSDCKTAWKSLRDQFVKARKEIKGKTGQEATEKKNYKYYDQLLFLKDSLQSRKRPSNHDHLTDESETMDSDVAAMLNVKYESEFIDDEVNEMLIPSTAGIPHSSTPTSSYSQGAPKKSKSSAKDDCLKELLTEIVSDIKSSNGPQGDNEQFFLNIAGMVSKANLTPKQTRQVQRKIFNLVADELDKIEENK